MTEPSSSIDFPSTDAALRDDVRTLGAMLGKLLVDLEGQPLFDAVESIRRTARARRAGDPTAADRLSAFLEQHDAEKVRTVVRAFSAYFGLVNMAERVHRIRRRRVHERQEQPQPGGVRAIVAELAERGFSREVVTGALEKMTIAPVFTAHPSEAIRRTILRKEQRIAYALVNRFDRAHLTPREDRAALGRIRAELASSWTTSEHGTRPTVADEVEHVAFYLVTVIYRAVPAFFEELEEAIAEQWPEHPTWAAPDRLLRFGSWVGGDMDGNPNVGADTFGRTLARQRKLVLDRYVDELHELADHLSLSDAGGAIDPRVGELFGRYATLVPEAASALEARYGDMPYRNLCLLMAARIRATQEDGAGAYPHASEFQDDLRLIEATMAEASDAAAGYRVRRLRRRAETFGFHLATIDIRQDSLVHRRAIADLLGDEGFVERSAEERTRVLLEALGREVPVPAEPGPDLERTLAMLRAVAEAQRTMAEHAVGPYIISMARGPDDPLAVLLLAKVAGVGTGDAVTLDIAPLFETADDLFGARETMEALFAEPVYREHLRRRGDRQMVMVGYSDSGKDAGIMAARWALQQGQRDLVEACTGAGVELTIFHGRGGTISRGGTKTREAVLAAPPGSVGGHLRMTEQGEIIHARYGLRGIALRSLELATGAVLQRTAGAVPRAQLEASEPRATLMETMATASRSAYRALVEDPRFLTYFRAATPIDVIERMAIGSRPASRRKQAGLEDLRAIPWVFAWTQSRQIVPGWFGAGSGLQAGIEATSLETVRTLAREWPFFDTLLADIEMVLAKTDMEIAARYAELADEASRGIFEVVLEEHARTRELILRVRASERILEGEPTLDRTLNLRNPYIDPMSFAQIALLRAWRAEGRPAGERLEALFSTVRGIARGLQNTG